jgi:glycosyltransferase involved in cell wall biosynthesis
MRILHVISTLDPAAGGPPMVATRLAASQAGLGHDVHLLRYHAGDAEPNVARSIEGLPHAAQVTWHALPRPGRIERVLARQAEAVIDALAPSCRMLHIHGVWDPIVRAAGRSARSCAVPYCIVLHGMLDPWSLTQKRLKKKLALALAYRRTLNGAAFLHTLNDDEQRLIGPLRLRAPCEVIPNGIFEEEIADPPPRGTFRGRYPALAQAPYVLFLSRLHYKKGLDYLADAFAIVAARHAQAHLVVAGPDGGERGPFEVRIRSAGLVDRVHVVGPLYGRDKLAALVDAACFCLPSRQEGFSMAITEAMALRLPVVISEACHFPEVAEAGAGDIIDLQPARIAEALLRQLADPALRARMGEAGRGLVLSRFTWPAIARRTIDAYHRHGARDG